MCVCVSQVPVEQPVSLSSPAEVENYEVCRVCVEELALYLKPISGAKGMCVCVCLFYNINGCGEAAVVGVHASHTPDGA